MRALSLSLSLSPWETGLLVIFSSLPKGLRNNSASPGVIVEGTPLREENAPRRNDKPPGKYVASDRSCFLLVRGERERDV